MNLLQKIKTYSNLGIKNVLKVGIYRAGLKTGLHPVLKITGTLPQDGNLFNEPQVKVSKQAIARKDWQGGTLKVFGKEIPSHMEPPNWTRNIYDTSLGADHTIPWWNISDFSTQTGDIKCIWEMSRFDWLIAMAQRAALGDREELKRLNEWLLSWCNHNETYLGPNWKCGQEASIRVLQTMLASHLTGNISNPTNNLTKFIESHLERIAPTISYAVGQANNHGTSEAAALFVGGHFLDINAPSSKGSQWHDLGRKWLEDRAITLIEPDGTFSQYSVNYHRMMLDTFSFVELWRRDHNLPAFSSECMARLKAATNWLHEMTNLNTGRTPLIGANDGAYILALTDCDYRDYRPSLQLASVLFQSKPAIKQDGKWDQNLHWLGIEKPDATPPNQNSITLKDGGFHILRQESAVAYLRYPNFRFRPGQSDALHCDFWVGDVNLLRDAGTFSYNTDETLMNYFNGTKGHNSIQFDNLDQMPRISRFLFGDWLKSKTVETVNSTAQTLKASAAYKNKSGHYHHRSIALESGKLIISDHIDGNFNNACLRWRLCPLSWKLQENTVTSDKFEIRFQSDDISLDPKLTTGYESEYYLHKNEIPVIEIELNKPSRFQTIVKF